MVKFHQQEDAGEIVISNSRSLKVMMAGKFHKQFWQGVGLAMLLDKIKIALDIQPFYIYNPKFVFAQFAKNGMDGKKRHDILMRQV
jgi:hypothetical protein